MSGIDVHQHLWPEPLLELLAARTTPPCARWDHGVWRVSIPGEHDFLLPPHSGEPEDRAQAVRDAGLHRALVALSSVWGIESLPASQARPLLDAWTDAIATLPDELGGWGAVSLDQPDPAEVDHVLDAGAVGVCLPASALADPVGVERVLPLLERLESRLAPLFVHPGPAPWRGHPAATVQAAWWLPTTRYVHDVHDAWHAFAAFGRPALPRLRVVWSFLAGLAPLHAERHAARGGLAVGATDPLSFYEPSSYGPRALRQIACAVGTGQLVHGTDAPVVQADTDPWSGLGTDALLLARGDNADRLLGTAWVAA